LPFKKDYKSTTHQTPTPIIEVYLPSNASTSEPDYSFRPYTDGGAFSGLQGYNFSESVDDLDGSFSFTINGEEENIFDLIPIRSVVKIYEVTDNYKFYPSFVGIIRQRKINKQMTNTGLKKVITFSGKSIISCLVEYSISLDMRISGVADATATNSAMLDKLEEVENMNIKSFMIETWKYFKKISDDVLKPNSEKTEKDIGGKGVATTELQNIINRFIGEDAENYIDVTGVKTKFYHPIGDAFINTGKNTIIDIWRDKLPQMAYELFAYCDNKGNPKIKARQVPFGDNTKNDYSDWKDLKLYPINPAILTSFDLDQNDSDVYTVFATWLIGSTNDRNYFIGINNDDQEDTTVFRSEKAKTYGFRPLEINFNGYDRSYNSDPEQQKGIQEAMAELNKLAAYWYSRNDEMYSGTLTVITDFKNPENNPRIGCRADFLGGEFYINKTDHSWNYGGTPIIKISVSRGMIYGMNGEMTEQLKDVGKKYRELDSVSYKLKPATFNR